MFPEVLDPEEYFRIQRLYTHHITIEVNLSHRICLVEPESIIQYLGEVPASMRLSCVISKFSSIVAVGSRTLIGFRCSRSVSFLSVSSPPGNDFVDLLI